MKLRFASSLLLVIVLFLTLTVSVDASPYQQDPQDALIRQVLTATAEELGWNTSVDYAVPPTGIPVWSIDKHKANGQLDGLIDIRAYKSTNAAKNIFQNEVGGGPGQHFLFHGYSAFSITVSGFTAVMFQSDRFLIESAGDRARDRLEVFYRHAVVYGLIAGDSSAITPAVTETVVPEVTLTPEPGTAITVRAYAENYDQVTDVINNSANFGSVSISGRVTNQNTGAAIGGATIKIISGAASGSTISAADGSYSLTAAVPGGQDSGVITGFDFALPVIADLTIEVIPNRTELAADGVSTSDITIQVKDLQGNPLKDRAFSLEISADAGFGTIQPAQATTDDNGVIHATYTAFKLEPGLGLRDTRHEVTVSARDNTTGLAGSNSIFVSQYQLAVLYGEYIPACTQCTFPSKFTVSVYDYWLNPIPNAPLTLRIEGGSSDGTLVLDPNSNENQQEITLTTDNNGIATVYYKWQGSVDINEAVQRVVILEGATNSQETKDVSVHGIDIGIARVEEAGFTGVTGQQAFLKIYIKEYAHPDLPLDRFNTDSPNKLGLRVIIRQYHSDGVNTSLTFDQTGGWEQDAGGLFVKMYATPYMPYIIPVNDGSSWYEVRVDPVIDHDVFLPDLFRPNNDNIFVLTTGSPDGWLHIWLQDGVLTPHTWTGVVFKCVGRFLPLVGDAMTVIDTLNQVYKADVLGLGQSTSQALTEELQRRVGKKSPSLLTKLKASALNNVASCLQDSYAVYKEKNKQGSSRSRGVCAKLVYPGKVIVPFEAVDENDAVMVRVYQDRFVQGVLLDLPDQRGVVVYGLEAGNVALRDASGLEFEDQDRMNVEGNVAVYILPVDEQFQLEVASDHAFDIGVYETGSDDTNRKTFRHEVQTDTNLTASMAIGGTSDYALELDYDNDGVFDKTLNAEATTLDVVKPQITSLHPEQGVTVSAKDASILTSYADNPGGIGIDPQGVEIFVDGVDLTSNAVILPEFLSLALSDIEVGEHTARLVVSDLDGNATIAEWTFTVQPGFSFSLDNPSLLFAVGGGVVLILLLGGVFLILLLGGVIAKSYRRKRRRTKL